MWYAATMLTFRKIVILALGTLLGSNSRHLEYNNGCMLLTPRKIVNNNVKYYTVSCDHRVRAQITYLPIVFIGDLFHIDII